ncbi:MAG: hypothetical protein IAF58_23120 [Leptolyngbya sp.]|nr:hypothetical protein [Candidatus Melainabacteria bacterium]
MIEKQHHLGLQLKKACLTSIAIAMIAASLLILPMSAAGPTDETALRAAWGLYTQQKYVPAAEAFEKLISVSTPNARLYHYAILANRAANRTVRAKQLGQYVITNFSTSQEAQFAAKIFPDMAPKSAVAVEALPEALKGKSVAELMKTEEGRKAVAEALAKKDTVSTIASTSTATNNPSAKRGRLGERVFTSADIAKDGANGIDQMYYPNCWFESSMSAVAMLPRGQRMMSEMIRYGEKDGSYVVRFPNDGQEYVITQEKLEKTGVHDKAFWATLIEAAQTMKFPDDDGGQLFEGLASMTGRPAEHITPGSASDQEISQFIDGAIKSQNPIVCATHHSFSGPKLVVGGHAYTIVGFDPASSMIKIRNPHGANSQRFSLANDPTHQKFEQLDDGVFKIHITLFKHYFDEIARAFI